MDSINPALLVKKQWEEFCSGKAAKNKNWDPIKEAEYRGLSCFTLHTPLTQLWYAFEKRAGIHGNSFVLQQGYPELILDASQCREFVKSVWHQCKKRFHVNPILDTPAPTVVFKNPILLISPTTFGKIYGRTSGSRRY